MYLTPCWPNCAPLQQHETRRIMKIAPRKKPLRGAAVFQARLPTPFALVGLRTEDGVLAEIVFLPRSMGALPPLDKLAERACAQIEKYADDPDYRFRLPLKKVGTDFQRRVWDAIAAVPRGQTLSYGRMARGIGSAARAVRELRKSPAISLSAGSWRRRSFASLCSMPPIASCKRRLSSGGLWKNPSSKVNSIKAVY